MGWAARANPRSAEIPAIMAAIRVFLIRHPDKLQAMKDRAGTPIADVLAWMADVDRATAK